MKQIEMYVQHTANGYRGTCEEVGIIFTASSREELKSEAARLVYLAFEAREEYHPVLCISFLQKFSSLAERTRVLPAPRWRTRRIR